MTFVYAGQLFRIVFSHRHHPDNKWPRRCRPLMPPEHFRKEHKGGRHFLVRAVTCCYIERKIDDAWDTKYRRVGIACCSLDDNFKKETGRKFSLGRALVGTDKRFKQAAWSAYFNRVPPRVEHRSLAWS